jgi:hypothetical protein
VFVVVLLGLALRYAPTRVGWVLAVSASVLVSPRLLMYQLSTLQSAVRPPDEPASVSLDAGVVPERPIGSTAMRP